MKFGIGCAILVGLTACASPPRQPAPAHTPPPPTALQVMMSTCDLSVRPDLQILSGKFPLSLGQIQQPGLSLLSTDRVPTVEEQAALSLYDQLHRSCVKAQANWLVDITFGMMPEANALQNQMFASEQSHLAALYKGEETFSQFTESVNALHVGFMNEFTRSAQTAYDKSMCSGLHLKPLRLAFSAVSSSDYLPLIERGGSDYLHLSLHSTPPARIPS